MNLFSLMLLRGLLTVSMALAALTAAAAADTDRYQVVDGVAIYLGLMPAEMVLGHPRQFPEKEMHGGIPQGKDRYHVVIALFDDATGKRISSAQVIATVSEAGSAGQRKALERMNIHNTKTYGNWFILSGHGPYRVHLEIAGIRGKGRIETEFEYKP
ncbi:hypothetical protein [Sulfuricella sp.]|uniref:hypothetical protein n=1 Tax=Sulfuricella sp. TaxID=2099377 RepID=UPI002C4788BE|nr:hypothetical protein [Sulfuricella sp.]HUX64491.1 hypothetical protein [Sulfuricella sp.]